jgi:flagellar biosynthesis/type III secretory pathway protein FliH
LPIVKKIHARELLRSAVVLDLGDVGREAADLIEVARNEAESLLADARIEAARLTECAAKIGRAEGMAAGEAAGRAEGLAAGATQGREEAMNAMAEELNSIATGWNEALVGLMASRDAIREEARRDLLRLSLAIAERVLGRLPAHQTSFVADQVSGAIEMLAGSTSLRITLNPEDVPAVEEHLPAVMATIRGSEDADVSIETDPEMVRGGCVVRAGDGEIDARLDVQMSKIVSGLFPELLENPPADSSASSASSESPLVPSPSPSPVVDHTIIGAVPPTEVPVPSNEAEGDDASSQPDQPSEWTVTRGLEAPTAGDRGPEATP